MKKSRKTSGKKRILCLGPLPPPVHGAAMMTKLIQESEHINSKVELDWVNLSTSRNMEEIGKRSSIKIVRFVTSYLKTLGKLLSKKYDACYLAITCHGSGFIKDAPFVLMCKMFGHRVILHQHNKGMSKDSGRPLFRWLFKKVYRHTTVILLSWKLYPDIESIVMRNQVKICPNGIPDVISLNHIPNERPTILFLSNLMESKGVITVLDACRMLKHRGYDFECRFIGGETKEIDHSRFIKEIASRDIEDRVVYGGKKYGEEKYLEFRGADIFVFPTYYDNECFPVVILEAMQHSLPIVSTSEGAIADLIDDRQTGMLVPPKDPEKLADALADLIDSPEKRKELGRMGKEKFNSNFTLSHFEKKMIDCLTAQID